MTKMGQGPNTHRSITQVSTRRARRGVKPSMKARRRGQEKLSRKSRSPEHNSTMQPCNRSRRSSQLVKCGCWDCERRSDREAAMEEHMEETGWRRMIVHATWTPEARSRTGSMTGSPTRTREASSSRSRTISPTGYRAAASVEDPGRPDQCDQGGGEGTEDI